jgi:pectinesterase
MQFRNGLSYLTALLLFSPFMLWSEDEAAYKNFLKRLRAEESYIGFFAAEEKCISKTTDTYMQARRAFFIGVSKSKEDPEEFAEPFFEYCKLNNLLREGCDEEWERILTILSYELYQNMPIFQYSTGEITAHRDIIFAEYPNKKMKLDLFISRNPFSKPVPVIVCIHGGGWHVNRRIWFEPFAKYLASRGFAAVTIDYRKLPAVGILECVHDSKAAVRWVRANAKLFGIDPDRIGALGASAGAQMAALLGTSADVPDLEGAGGNSHISSAVQAVVGIATPSFNPETSREFAARFDLTLEELKQVSPYEHITSASAPIFLIHGDRDETVPPHNAQELYDKYIKVGAFAELKWIKGAGHGFYEGTDVAIKMAADYFKRQFMNGLKTGSSVEEKPEG